MSSGGKPPSSGTKIVLAVVVLVVVGLFAYFYYVEGQNNTPAGLLIDWRLKITFLDASNNPAVNYTLPAMVGRSPQYWSNHTLDAFSPNNTYSPMSTRDGTSTIWIQSTEPAVFNFGDFFNVYGQVFNETCVGYSGVVGPSGATLSGTYCAAASEAVIYDTAGTGHYNPSQDINVTTGCDPFCVKFPPTGASLSSDPHIMFVSNNNYPTWNSTESIVYDSNGNGQYDATDRVIYPGTGQALTSGMSLSNDPKLKFYDRNVNGRWDSSVPPPILSDGNHPERCLSRGINFSNGYDWLIIIWSKLYTTISDHCVPRGQT